MGVIGAVVEFLFGNGRNVVAETVEVFRENAEARAVRVSETQSQALTQMAGEFRGARRSGFDVFMDGVNRLPRPSLALGTLALFVAAMVDPLWFAERMQGVALVPEPLWWLLGVIVSFYFGARHQAKAQNFQREIAQTVAGAPVVMRNLAMIQDLRADSPGRAQTGPDAALSLSVVEPDDNPALADWRRKRAA